MSKERFAGNYEELDVFKNAMDVAMQIFLITKKFPKEEKYSITDQIRRSSRSVCANLGESWRKRRYKKAFISRLSDAESEASETEVWLEISRRCGYINNDLTKKLKQKYEVILGQLVKMIEGADKWVI